MKQKHTKPESRKQKSRMERNNRKTCTTCHQEKNASEFELWGTRCTECTRAYQSRQIKDAKKRRREGNFADLRRTDPESIVLTGKMKVCAGQCGLEKDEVYFQLRTDSGKRRPVCKDCRQEYVKDYKKDRWNNRREKKSPNLAQDGLKTCGKCGKTKPVELFPSRSDSKDGLRNQCQECRNQSYLDWILSTNDRLIADQVRKHISLTFLNLRKRRIHSDSLVLMKRWLEFQFDDKMTWENWGTYWHIDHILPLSKFNMSNQDERALCCNWKNLQPLQKSENLSKNGKIMPHYFWNSVINLNRFITKHNLPKQEYQGIRESICWLREKN